MNLICKMLGGSHSYGTNVASSDLDYRGVFVSNSIKEIIGIKRLDHQVFKNEGDDYSYVELRQFFRHLQKANTTSLELLFNNNWLETMPQWSLIVSHRNYLLDTEATFRCLMGYIQGEKRLFNGGRTGDLGSKRRQAIGLYHYSPKNYIHAVRLAWSGIIFFTQGIFPVYIPSFNTDLAAHLVDVRQNPQNHDKAVLMNTINIYEEQLRTTFDTRTINYKFNKDIANQLCFDIYWPILKKHHDLNKETTF